MSAPARPPWEPDPDGPPRVLSLGECLLGLEHFGREWMHCTQLQYVGHDGEPDGPPRDGLMWMVKREAGPLPKALRLAVSVYEPELLAIADCRRMRSEEPWRVAPAPPLSFEESQQTLRELRVDLWLAELGRAAGRE
jgi:hypothetical protein